METDVTDIEDSYRRIPLYTVIVILGAVVAAFAFMYFDGYMKVHTHKAVTAFDAPKAP